MPTGRWGRGARFGAGRLVGLALVSVALTTGALADAQPAPTDDRPAAGAAPVAPSEAELAEARRLFFAAVEEQDAGRYRDALALYARVEAVVVSPTLVFNMAACHEKLGELVAAHAAFERSRALAGAAGDSEVQSEAGRRLEALSPQIPRLRVHLSAGVQGPVAATLDGRLVAIADLADRPVDPGAHRLVVRSERHARSFDRSFEVARSSTFAVDVELGPVRAAARQLARPAEPTQARPTYAPAFVAGGAALSLGVAATVTGALSHARLVDYEELNRRPTAANRSERESLASEGEALQIANGILVGAGLVALAATVYFVVAPPRRPAPPRRSVGPATPGASPSVGAPTLGRF